MSAGMKLNFPPVFEGFPEAFESLMPILLFPSLTSPSDVCRSFLSYNKGKSGSRNIFHRQISRAEISVPKRRNPSVRDIIPPSVISDFFGKTATLSNQVT